MIDLHTLRENPKEIFELLERRGVSRDSLEDLVQADRQVRSLFSKRDALRAKINDLSKEVGKAYRDKNSELAQAHIDASKSAGVELELLSQQALEAEHKRNALWMVIPNIPDPKAPIGSSEQENLVVRYWHPENGYSTVLPEVEYSGYKKVAHWDIGIELDILDFARAAKLSGSMFPMFKGSGARMLRALTSFALDQHTDEFLEIRPPSFVRRETMISTGHLPKFADDAYQIEADDLWAIPTAEVPLTSMARDEILEDGDLPIKMTAATPCYRREAGSAGRDTRGLLRLHEFDKVELMVYAKPDHYRETFDEILRRAEDILQKLGLYYRVLDLCTGDLGASARRTFDLEVFAPGVERWLEVSSVSWFGDYQARRANIRYRNAIDQQIYHVHTLNGSALAWPRVFAAILENFRDYDGSVEIPKVLVPYMGGLDRILPISGGVAKD